MAEYIDIFINIETIKSKEVRGWVRDINYHNLQTDWNKQIGNGIL